jgi:hypothetical protein
MAAQQTGSPPKKGRFGVIPDSSHKFFIIFLITLFLLTGVIGGIGIWKNWGIVYNLIFLLLAVGSMTAGILTFWPSASSNETVAPAPSEPPRSEPVLITINNYAGQQTEVQRITSSNNESPGLKPTPGRNGINLQQQPSNNRPDNPSTVYNPPLTNSPGLPAQASPPPELDQDLLGQAQFYILSARQAIIAAARPFAGKGSLFSRHYHDAITQLTTTIEHMRSLLELLPVMISRHSEQNLPLPFSDHEKIKVEIYRTIDEAEKMISLLQQEEEKDRQNIVQKAMALEKLLQELMPAPGE